MRSTVNPEVQKALPPAGVFGAEPQSLMHSMFPGNQKALLPGDGGQSVFFNSLSETARITDMVEIRKAVALDEEK